MSVCVRIGRMVWKEAGLGECTGRGTSNYRHLVGGPARVGHTGWEEDRSVG